MSRNYFLSKNSFTAEKISKIPKISLIFSLDTIDTRMAPIKEPIIEPIPIGKTTEEKSFLSEYILFEKCFKTPIMIVGMLIKRLTVPANLMSTPKTNISVGIISSPPATPKRLLMNPIIKPQNIPTKIIMYICSSVIMPETKGTKLSKISKHPMKINNIRITLLKNFSVKFFEKSTPKKAPVIEPQIIDTITAKRGIKVSKFILGILKQIDDITVIRLIAILMATAFREGYLNNPTRTGRRNSAPPKPINPPRQPIGVPVAKASIAERFLSIILL